MSLFKRKPIPPAPDDLADRLRSAERRLRGWTVTGDGIALDRLLNEAAREIDRLRADSQEDKT